MTQELESARFNQMLDIALGIGGASGPAGRELEPGFQELLDLAAKLSAADFQDELRPARVARKQLGRKERAASIGGGHPHRRRAAFVVVTLLALLGITLLAIGPERALAALRGLLGYLPGIGFVDSEAGLRVLVEPVSQTREGVTVTIEEVIADSQRTVVVYTADGLSVAAANSRGEGGPFGSTQSLRLQDGTILDVLQESGYGGTPEPLIGDIRPQGGWPNYVLRLVYPPVGSDVDELALIIPILETMPAGAAPENWELTFRLVPAPADMTLAPIAVLGPSSETAGAAVPADEAAGASALSNVATRQGFTFELDNVVELEDGFVLTGRLTWEDSVFSSGNGMVSGVVIPTLTDADGRVIPIEEVRLDALYREHEIPWSYRTNRKVLAGPLVLSLSTVDTTMFSAAAELEIDLGPDPQIGQSWEIHRDFDFAGHTVRLLSLLLRESPDSCSMSALEFAFTSDEPGISALVEDDAPQPPLEGICGGGGGGGGPVDPRAFYGLVTYRALPTGMHRFSIRASIPYVVDGPWEIAWQPPLIPGPTAAPEPEACLTLEGWRQLIERSESLPPGLGGTIVVSLDAGVPTPMVEPAPSFPEIQIGNLDGSGRVTVVHGGWPALSPDGTRLLFTDERGFHLLDLSSGQDALLEVDGYAPIWSPDGSRVLFASVPGLGVMLADGSGARQIDVDGAEISPPVGWLPDNHAIVYSVMTGEGFGFVMRDLRTGAEEELFSVQNKWGFGTVSPDGGWIATLDRVFGATGYGVFLSRLDGSGRRLVAAPDVPASFRLVWSPDSRWLLINTRDYPESDATPAYRPVLIELSTCRAIALPDVHGQVEGWAR